MQTARRCGPILTKFWLVHNFQKPPANIKFHEIPSSRSLANMLGETDGRFQQLTWTGLKTNKRRKVTAAESKGQKHGKTTKKSYPFST